MTTRFEAPTKDTARPPFWIFKQEAYDAKLAEAIEAAEEQAGPNVGEEFIDFDWGDYADFWEDNRAAVDAYYRRHRDELVTLLEAHPEERTASLKCLREQYRACCEATERRGGNRYEDNPVRRQGERLPIVTRDDQPGAQMLTGREDHAFLFDSPIFFGSVDPATGKAQGFGVPGGP